MITEWNTNRESVECARCFGDGVIVGQKGCNRHALIRCPKCSGWGFRVVRRSTKPVDPVDIPRGPVEESPNTEHV